MENTNAWGRFTLTFQDGKLLFWGHFENDRKRFDAFGLTFAQLKQMI